MVIGVVVMRVVVNQSVVVSHTYSIGSIVAAWPVEWTRDACRVVRGDPGCEHAAVSTIDDDQRNIRRPVSQPVVVDESSCLVEDWADTGRNGVSWRTLISADRTPTDSLTMGVAEIQPGSPDELHLHRHEPAEVYYILAGTGVVSIDGVVHDVSSGSAVFVPSNAVHAVGNTGVGVLRLLYVFGVDSFDDVTYVFPS